MRQSGLPNLHSAEPGKLEQVDPLIAGSAKVGEEVKDGKVRGKTAQATWRVLSEPLTAQLLMRLSPNAFWTSLFQDEQDFP